MRPIDNADLAEILDAVPLDDEALFRRRMAFVRDVGLDERTIVATMHTLQVMPLAFSGRRFDIDIRGVDPEPAVIIGALDFDAYTIVDMVAWPLDAPHRMASYAGHVAMVGLDQLTRYPLTIFSEPFPVHRTVEEWMRAGCIGCVPIEPHRAARLFLEFDGTLLAEDDAHGAELAAARQDLVDRAPRIMVAENRQRAA